MGCRCNERRDALRQGAAAAVRGDMRGVVQSLGYVARTMTQDARNGDLRRAATQRLAQLRRGGR